MGTDTAVMVMVITMVMAIAMDIVERKRIMTTIVNEPGTWNEFAGDLVLQ